MYEADKKINIFGVLSLLRDIINRRIELVFILFAIVSITDVFGISIVVPTLIGSNTDSNLFEGFLKEIFQLLTITASWENTVIAIILIFLMKSIFQFLSFSIATRTKSLLVLRMRQELSSLLLNTHTKHHSYSAGEYNNILTDQINKVAALFSSLTNLIIDISSLVIYAGFSIYLSFEVSLLVGMYSAFLIPVFLYINKKVKINSKRLSKSILKFSSVFYTNYINFKYLLGTNRLDFAMFEQEKSIKSYYNIDVKIGVLASLIRSVKEPLGVILLSLILLLNNSSDVANILVVLLIIYRTVSSLISMQSSYQSMMENSASLVLVSEQINALRIFNVEKKFKKNTSYNDDLSLIQLSNPKAKYQDEFLPRCDVSIGINKGEKIAIIGKSGSGKTTLLDMLLGFVEVKKGSIKFFNSKKVSIEVGEARNSFGLVIQNQRLNAGSLTNSFSIDLCSNDLNLALNTCCSDFLNLNDSEFSLKNIRSEDLSGGQRQKILISNELSYNRNFLILDEATSALDDFGERELLKSLFINYPNLAVLSITHKKANLDLFDQVIEIS